MTKTVLYSCPFVPTEWIAAHGLRPRRIVPSSAQAASSVEVTFGVCTYARAFVQEAVTDANASLVVVTTLCDQMRRAPELIARRRDVSIFLMNVPSTWQTVAAQGLYRDELERLGRTLVGLGGRCPSTEALAETMLGYDERRSALRAARESLGSRRYAEAIAEFHETGRYTRSSRIAPPWRRGIALALVGGPMLREDRAIFDLVEQAGGWIALDGTETGERTVPAPFDRRCVRDDPLTELTRAYFGTIPDVSRRPNSGLYEWIKREASRRGIRGVIYRRHVWCDLWHAELHRFRESIDVPVLDLESGYDDDQSSRTRLTGRIQAFLEMLR